MKPEVTGPELIPALDRVVQLDPDAWEAIHRRLYPGLLGYAARRLGVERAHDAVGETMARAVGAIERFEWKGGGFEAWVYGILRHVVLDAQRACGREARRRLPHADPCPDPLDHVLDGERAIAMRRAFGRLPAADRELLELRVVAGMSADEVGEVLGKRPGAVRMAQSRALERLRREMDDEGAW
jgi:RNA polymerase sigma-70 factor (ECF subfamily)